MCQEPSFMVSELELDATAENHFRAFVVQCEGNDSGSRDGNLL